ncbi:MAG TPA: FHA domain-containing protein [Desulfobacterales bacterium]|nr:FHA domain-containing protein [Desulfobacterales bacterium]
MNLLGLELSDAGILVAGGDPPRLLPIDEECLESPGFALPDKKALATGIAAERRARLFPRQIMNRFWDSLSTDPLDRPLPAAGNQAEVACAHLAQIWNKAHRFGNALVIAVPAGFQRTQLGLLLGMSQELGIPVQGFASLPVAAAAPGPECLHLHVDVHLHRFEVSILKTEGRLEFQEVLTVNEKGLEGLHKLWAQAAAAEFVRTTRFDPFHSAETEQELYRRLPAVLAALQREPATTLAIAAGHSNYSVSLMRAMMLQTARPVYDELLSAVHDAMRRGAAPGTGACLQVSQRVARLPGILEHLRRIPNTRLVELPAGSAALALPALWRELTDGRRTAGASFFSSRPWVAAGPSAAAEQTAASPRPTHLLYRNLAYPLTAAPLTVGTRLPAESRGIRIAEDAGGIDRQHCAVQLQGEKAVLTDLSSNGTFLNDLRVEGSVALKVGDAIRLGNTAETIVLIACLDRNEA